MNANHQPQNPSRRRLARGGLAAPIVLASLTTKHAFASNLYHCTVSGQMSGNMSPFGPNKNPGASCATGMNRAQVMAALQNDSTTFASVFGVDIYYANGTNATATALANKSVLLAANACAAAPPAPVAAAPFVAAPPPPAVYGMRNKAMRGGYTPPPAAAPVAAAPAAAAAPSSCGAPAPSAPSAPLAAAPAPAPRPYGMRNKAFGDVSYESDYSSSDYGSKAAMVQTGMRGYAPVAAPAQVAAAPVAAAPAVVAAPPAPAAPVWKQATLYQVLALNGDGTYPPLDPDLARMAVVLHHNGTVNVGSDQYPLAKSQVIGMFSAAINGGSYNGTTSLGAYTWSTPDVKKYFSLLYA